MTKIICSNCHSSIDSDALFCENCGQKIEFQETKSPAPLDEVIIDNAHENKKEESPQKLDLGFGITLDVSDDFFDPNPFENETMDNADPIQNSDVDIRKEEDFLESYKRKQEELIEKEKAALDLEELIANKEDAFENGTITEAEYERLTKLEAQQNDIETLDQIETRKKREEYQREIAKLQKSKESIFGEKQERTFEGRKNKETLQPKITIGSYRNIEKEKVEEGYDGYYENVKPEDYRNGKKRKSQLAGNIAKGVAILFLLLIFWLYVKFNLLSLT